MECDAIVRSNNHMTSVTFHIAVFDWWIYNTFRMLNNHTGWSKRMSGFSNIAELMKALAHPVRLQILEVLEEEGEACVCHLESRLNQRQAYISQQLGRLRQAGLVEDRRDGLNVYYALTSVAVAQLLDQAKQVASAISKANGDEIAFEIIRPAHPEICTCPKCEQRIGTPVVQ